MADTPASLTLLEAFDDPSERSVTARIGVTRVDCPCLEAEGRLEIRDPEESGDGRWGVSYDDRPARHRHAFSQCEKHPQCARIDEGHRLQIELDRAAIDFGDVGEHRIQFCAIARVDLAAHRPTTRRLDDLERRPARFHT